MTKPQKTLIAILNAIFLCSFVYFYLLGKDFNNMDWAKVIWLPSVSLILPACLITIILCAITSQYEKVYRILIWTNTAGLIIAICIDLRSLSRQINAEHTAENKSTASSYSWKKPIPSSAASYGNAAK